MRIPAFIIVIVFIAIGLAGYGCFHDNDGFRTPDFDDGNWGQMIWDQKKRV